MMKITAALLALAAPASAFAPSTNTKVRSLRFFHVSRILGDHTVSNSPYNEHSGPIDSSQRSRLDGPARQHSTLKEV